MSPESGPPGQDGTPVVRASDADREAIVTRLQTALGEGRIELEVVVADLPSEAPPPVEIVGTRVPEAVSSVFGDVRLAGGSVPQRASTPSCTAGRCSATGAPSWRPCRASRGRRGSSSRRGRCSATCGCAASRRGSRRAGGARSWNGWPSGASRPAGSTAPAVLAGLSPARPGRRR